MNVLRGITKNTFFIPIVFVIVIAQIILVFFGSAAFKTTPITGSQWAACILIGFISLPLGFLIRLLPDELFNPFKNCFKPSNNRGNTEDRRVIPMMMSEVALKTDDSLQEKDSYSQNVAKQRWNMAITSVRTDIHIFKVILLIHLFSPLYSIDI